MFLDVSEIINHIHSITFCISCREVNEGFAGKRVALIAEFNVVFQECVAFFLKKCALLVSLAATNAVW